MAVCNTNPRTVWPQLDNVHTGETVPTFIDVLTLLDVGCAIAWTITFCPSGAVDAIACCVFPSVALLVCDKTELSTGVGADCAIALPDNADSKKAARKSLCMAQDYIQRGRWRSAIDG